MVVQSTLSTKERLMAQVFIVMDTDDDYYHPSWVPIAAFTDPEEAIRHAYRVTREPDVIMFNLDDPSTNWTWIPIPQE